MASRRLDDLMPEVRERAEDFLGLAADAGLDVLIYCTHRSLAEQARIYRQGRPAWRIREKAAELRDELGRPDLADILMGVGPQYERTIRTNAAPGQSLHNYRLAFDGVPLVNGKPVWGTTDPDDAALWQRYGELAARAGLEWAGNWRSFTEFPHCQLPGADWRELIQEGGDG